MREDFVALCNYQTGSLLSSDRSVIPVRFYRPTGSKILCSAPLFVERSDRSDWSAESLLKSALFNVSVSDQFDRHGTDRYVLVFCTTSLAFCLDELELR